jgi:ribosomal protein L29
MAATIDTLRLAKRFREVDLTERQAELLADVFRESREPDLERLATKADIAELRTEFAELRAEFAELRAELKAEVADLRTELRSGLADLRAELKAEVADLRTELRSGLADLRGEIARSRNAQTMWIVPLLFAQVGALLYLLLRPLLGMP